MRIWAAALAGFMVVLVGWRGGPEGIYPGDR